jgi:L-2-hydroxyglutarate oxidase LhgO
MEEIDCVVIGAGVIGLAVARALAQRGLDVIIVERELAIGTHTSSRNSEVIHAGIYYPPGSLIARLCVEGRLRLYDYAESHQVPFARCGKLIVAVEMDECAQLDKLAARAAANGVDDLAFIDGAEARRLEPNLNGVAALLSPSSGIIDSHAYMQALQGDAEAAGTMIAFGCPLIAVRGEGSRFELLFGGDAPYSIRARRIVNAAGLFACEVAHSIDCLAKSFIPQAYFARGNYFVLSGRSPFRRLIYPVPTPGGLGTHLTLDLSGNARFGPDVEWIDGIDYTVNETRRDSFVAAIRRYWSGIDPARLQPGYAGIRPKIVPPGAPSQDFVIQGEAIHGVPGLVNLFGIESPGLTASLAIAERVAGLIEGA